MIGTSDNVMEIQGVSGLTAEHVRCVYGSGAKHYDRIMATVYAALIDRPRVMEVLNPASGESILEVGIGTGLNLQHFPAGIRLTGTDFTPEMLDEAERKRGQFRGDSMRLMLEDTSSLPFPDGAFDAVLGTLTLCVMPDPEAGLREMKRVCKPGGRIVIFEMARSPHPIIAQMQDFLIRPRTTTVGFPPPDSDFPQGVIVWDPARDYVHTADSIGFGDPIAEWLDADHPVMARQLLSWRRV